MGKRGPKPVNIGELSFREFEFYKAFHLLRDGALLPTLRSATTPPSQITRAQIKSWIQRLKRMDEVEWLLINRRACEAIQKSNGHAVLHPTHGLTQPDLRSEVQRHWARMQKEQEIRQLERYLNPKAIVADASRRKLWADLVGARTIASLTSACDEWSSLADVRAAGLSCFSSHVLANGQEFLRMKNDGRFPKSNHPAFDESRLEYLARGMAGILENISPMTAIERLRNMKHKVGGPLWKTEPGGHAYCACWRCEGDRWRAVTKIGAESWWNGIALLMQIGSEAQFGS